MMLSAWLARGRAWVLAREASFFVYLAATVGAAGVTFYTIKFVIAFLTRAQYGVWGYYAALSAMLLPVASLSLPQAMMRMYFDRDAADGAGQASLVTTTLLLNLGGAAALAAAAGALFLFGGRNALLLAYVGTVSTGAVVLSFCNYLARVRNDYGLYAFNKLFETATFALVAAWAGSTLAAGAGAGGAAAGGLAGTLGVAADRLLFLTRAYAAVLWTVNAVNLAWFVSRGVVSARARLLPRAEVRALLAFSIPLSGTYFLGWTLASSDIWLLKRFSTLDETADYVFAVGVASVVSLVTQSALVDWPRFYYARMRDGGPARDSAIAQRVELFLWLHVAAILGVRVVARFAYELLGAHAYAAGLEYVRYLLLGDFFFLCGNLFAAGIGYAKRTQLNLVTFAVPGALNVGLNLFLVPRWGARAAALTTLGAYACFALVSFAIGQRYYKFTRRGRLLAAAAGATAAALVPLGLGV
jgi:O-antigen/teichoic acid export membrane protein